MIIKCDICGKEFTPGNRPDGIPNGVGIVQKDGTIVNICADCVYKIGVTGEVPAWTRGGAK